MDFDIKKYLRSDQDSLEIYHPIKPFDVLAEEIGVPVDKLVKLDANENLYGPIQEIRDAIAKADLHIYPDPGQIKLRRAIGEFLHVPEDSVIGGSGADDIIDILIRLVDPPAIIVPTPTFGMYSFLGKINRSKIVDVPRGPAPHFEAYYDQIERLVRDHAPNGEVGRVMVMLTSPNNPTGGVLMPSQVEKFCNLGCMIVLDEAYAEFATEGVVGGVGGGAGASAGANLVEEGWHSAVRLVPQHPNLIILRTFSKWAGLAGLRIGYAVGHPTLIKWMMSIKQPYNVSAVGDIAARTALTHIDKVMVTVNAIIAERARLFAQLAKFWWLEPIPTQSNFILTHVAGPVPASQVASHLRSKGILIRYFTHPAVKEYIRVSVGRPQDTDKLVEALTDIEQMWRGLRQDGLFVVPSTFQPQAVLFDMDGVLADVSQSYRRAIIETAAHFGANITNTDISVAKSAGNANNDWILSHRLIHAVRDPPGAPLTLPTLVDVTNKFEELYQGTQATQGLCETETCLIDPGLLAYLRDEKRMKLAIVTGRPRSDAEKFLNKHNLAQYFEAVVCMEDARLKPSPEPVLLALKQLGVKQGYMIGDTPDDIRAAVAAAFQEAFRNGSNSAESSSSSSSSSILVVGLGILSPGERSGVEKDAITQSLVGAGALKVIDTLEELRALV
eukprot:TRINITY_DN1563_c0_g1_i1.p1 TRINITY_DN1563_c0_g1~~TRINITY_DN1563_c0_g1_i1.p1  ORF type:complete len:670 (+),score=148.27 TRINITY_DN1563_c0_g1_i1:1385-3394(+)